jgi:hypothetical protein
VGSVLADPLQAPLDEPLYVLRVQGKPEIELLVVVAVVVAYSCPALEHGLISP